MNRFAGALVQPNDGPVADQVYRLIRAGIVGLRLLPGSRISENTLVEQIGVSRTPIREALSRLEGDRLVHVFAQRGSFVAPFDMQVIRSAFTIRSAVEAAVAAEAAVRRSAADVIRLRAMLAAQQDLTDAPASADSATDRFFELNRAFHRELMKIADLAGVESVVDIAKIQLDRVRVAHLTFSDPYPLPPLVAEHAAIVGSIEAGDRAGAEAAMREHIAKVLPRLDLLRQQRPEFFTLPRDLARPLTLTARP